MFDFRYHALSLIAVFVALVLGLLLGVAIGDKGLVSSAENNIKESLRADVRAEQRKSADLSDRLAAQQAAQQKFEQEVFPVLVSGQLTDRKVGVVFLGQSSDEINNEVSNAMDASDGKRVGAVNVREPLAVGDLAARAAGTQYAGLATGDDKLWEAFGARMGVQLTRPGGKLLKRERRSLFSAVAGSTRPDDRAGGSRHPPDRPQGDDLPPHQPLRQGV